MNARRHSPPPRRFRLVRDHDVSGVSGLGVVAHGVQFADGAVVTRWDAEIAQTCVWASIADVEHVHGHGGATRIVWIDSEDPMYLATVDDGGELEHG